MRRLRPTFFKAISWLMVGVYVLTASDSVLFAAPRPEPAAVLETKAIDVHQFYLPETIGTVKDFYQGEAGQGTVILVQDAHAIPEAQRNIRNAIDFLQQQYGISTVAVEGTSGSLNPFVFRHFPDKDLLKKVFQVYLEEGELTGTTMAAVFNQNRGNFIGIEDPDLYNLGYGAFLSSLRNRESDHGLFDRFERELNRRKEEQYSQELLAVDRELLRFYRDELPLIDLLRTLSEFQLPAPQSSIDLVLQSAAAEISHSQPRLEKEVRALAQKVKYGLQHQSNPLDNRREVLADFNQSMQSFQLSEITPQEFAYLLTEMSIKLGLKVRVSEQLNQLMRTHKTMRDLEGTAFFAELESYAEEVKKTLMRGPADETLNRESDNLYLLGRLMDLKLSPADWQHLQNRSFSPAMEALKAGFTAQLQFYENTLERDALFFEKIQKMLETDSQIMLVAGGFHTENLTNYLRRSGVSYAVLMPEIRRMPEQNNYINHLNGIVSWRHYYQPQNGRVNAYEAFIRYTRDRLTQQSTASKGLVLKEWRDSLIRALSDEGKITEAGDYTQFIDELTDVRVAEGQRRLLRDFGDKLRALEREGAFNQSNVMNLLKPANLAASHTTRILVNRFFNPAPAFVPRYELRSDAYEHEDFDPERHYVLDNIRAVRDNVQKAVQSVLAGTPANQQLDWLDIGSGRGLVASTVLRDGADQISQLWVTDNSAKMLASAQDKLSREFADQENITYQQLNLRNLNAELGDRQFDVISIANVLNYFSAEERQAFFTQARQHLKPGGRLLIAGRSIDEVAPEKRNPFMRHAEREMYFTEPDIRLFDYPEIRNINHEELVRDNFFGALEDSGFAVAEQAFGSDQTLSDFFSAFEPGDPDAFFVLNRNFWITAVVQAKSELRSDEAGQNADDAEAGLKADGFDTYRISSNTKGSFMIEDDFEEIMQIVTFNDAYQAMQLVENHGSHKYAFGQKKSRVNDLRDMAHEMATNIIDHADAQGVIAIRTAENGVEIIAQDFGAGIAEPQTLLERDYALNRGKGLKLYGRLTERYEGMRVTLESMGQSWNLVDQNRFESAGESAITLGTKITVIVPEVRSEQRDGSKPLRPYDFQRFGPPFEIGGSHFDEFTEKRVRIIEDAYLAFGTMFAVPNLTFRVIPMSEKQYAALLQAKQAEEDAQGGLLNKEVLPYYLQVYERRPRSNTYRWKTYKEVLFSPGEKLTIGRVPNPFLKEIAETPGLIDLEDEDLGPDEVKDRIAIYNENPMINGVYLPARNNDGAISRYYMEEDRDSLYEDHRDVSPDYVDPSAYMRPGHVELEIVETPSGPLLHIVSRGSRNGVFVQKTESIIQAIPEFAEQVGRDQSEMSQSQQSMNDFILPKGSEVEVFAEAPSIHHPKYPFEVRVEDQNGQVKMKIALQYTETEQGEAQLHIYNTVEDSVLDLLWDENQTELNGWLMPFEIRTHKTLGRPRVVVRLRDQAVLDQIREGANGKLPYQPRVFVKTLRDNESAPDKSMSLIREARGKGLLQAADPAALFDKARTSNERMRFGNFSAWLERTGNAIQLLIMDNGRIKKLGLPHILEEGKEITIGRHPDNDIVISTERASRFHAALVFENGRVFLEDRGAKNGTYVNDRRIERQEITFRSEFRSEEEYSEPELSTYKVYTLGQYRETLYEIFERVESVQAIIFTSTESEKGQTLYLEGRDRLLPKPFEWLDQLARSLFTSDQGWRDHLPFEITLMQTDKEETIVNTISIHLDVRSETRSLADFDPAPGKTKSEREDAFYRELMERSSVLQNVIGGVELRTFEIKDNTASLDFWFHDNEGQILMTERTFDGQTATLQSDLSMYIVRDEDGTIGVPHFATNGLAKYSDRLLRVALWWLQRQGADFVGLTAMDNRSRSFFNWFLADHWNVEGEEFQAIPERAFLYDIDLSKYDFRTSEDTPEKYRSELRAEHRMDAGDQVETVKTVMDAINGREVSNQKREKASTVVFQTGAEEFADILDAVASVGARSGVFRAEQQRLLDAFRARFKDADLSFGVLFPDADQVWQREDLSARVARNAARLGASEIILSGDNVPTQSFRAENLRIRQTSMTRKVYVPGQEHLYPMTVLKNTFEADAFHEMYLPVWATQMQAVSDTELRDHIQFLQLLSTATVAALTKENPDLAADPQLLQAELIRTLGAVYVEILVMRDGSLELNTLAADVMISMLAAKVIDSAA